MTPAELLSILKCLSKDTPRHTSRLELHTGVISEQPTTCEGLSAAFWLTVWTWTGLGTRKEALFYIFLLESGTV